MIATRWKTPLLLAGIVTSPLLLAGCSQTTSSHGMSVSGLTSALTPSFLTTRTSHSTKDKECLQRAMFFESNRSSRDGMIAVGSSLAQAMWLAVEVETLARQYHGALQIGEPPILSDEEIENVIKRMASYGLRDKEAAA